MDAGGFAHCAECRGIAWIGGDAGGLCAPCLDRATRVVPEAVVEAEPVVAPEPVSVIKGVRKAVRRAYDEGRLGTKPKRAEVISLARALWDELPQVDRDRLLADIEAKGHVAADPFEAMVDYCRVVVRKRRAARST